MALYYFHLRDGVDVLLDPEGCELSNLAAAEARALASARSILGADALEGLLKLDMRVDVEDSMGVIVHSLEFQDAVVITPPDA